MNAFQWPMACPIFGSYRVFHDRWTFFNSCVFKLAFLSKAQSVDFRLYSEKVQNFQILKSFLGHVSCDM